MSGNSTVPSDAVFDEYYATRCDCCGRKFRDSPESDEPGICEECQLAEEGDE